MAAEDFLQDPQIRGWLDGVEPAWTLLTFESLRALRREPSAAQTAIRIANDLSVGEIAASLSRSPCAVKHDSAINSQSIRSCRKQYSRIASFGNPVFPSSALSINKRRCLASCINIE